MFAWAVLDIHYSQRIQAFLPLGIMTQRMAQTDAQHRTLLECFRQLEESSLGHSFLSKAKLGASGTTCSLT